MSSSLPMHFLHNYSMMQPSSIAHRVFQTLQVDLDRILCDVLEKYYSFPGVTLLLGSFLHRIITIKQTSLFPPGMVASLYLLRQRGEGHILDAIGLSGIVGINSFSNRTAEFLTYLSQLLENPERAGTCIFDQQRYTAAAKECLQLYLCSYPNFSKGATEPCRWDRELRRNKPSAWIARMGVHSRIRKGRHHLQVQLRVKAEIYIHQHVFTPDGPNSPGPEYYRSWSYQWALDLLPFFLENSKISLELADVLHRRTFTMMAQQFPRRKRLAKEAIAKYLLRVESAAGNS